MFLANILFLLYFLLQLVPYTIMQTKNTLLQLIQWHFLAHDEGEKHLESNKEWCEEEVSCLNKINPSVNQITSQVFYFCILIWLLIPPMDALLFPGRLRPGKRSASIGRRIYIYLVFKIINKSVLLIKSLLSSAQHSSNVCTSFSRI